MALTKFIKAASSLMAAFLVSGCQRREGMFFPVSGGDPIVFQHFFWFIGHPEVFLPLLLIASVLVILMLRRVSNRFAVFASQPLSFKFTLPRLWLYSGFIFIFLNFGIGYIWSLLTSRFSLGDRYYLYDNYYVFAHIHYVLFLSSFFLLFAFLYWLFGRFLRYACNRILAAIQFLSFVIGMGFILIPSYLYGLESTPRRYMESPDQFSLLNTLANVGGSFCLISAAAFFIVIIEALVKKRPIGDRDAPKKSEPS